jgi:uncharacterized hydrophobic protein (TIGR00271 family)
MLFDKKIQSIKARLGITKANEWLNEVHKNRIAQQAVDQLIQSSRLKQEFFVMCGLSGILATLGILLNDTAILIGAMVLAPLLNPVLAFAAGISLMHHRLILYAAKSFFGAVGFIVLTSALFVAALAYTGHEQLIDLSNAHAKFEKYDTFLLLAAFISGYAGVYAWLRPTNQLNLIGVAIAVSLVPVVSFFGILLGLGRFTQLGYYITPFAFNLVLIIVGATLAFVGLGFTRERKEIDEVTVSHKEQKD